MRTLEEATTTAPRIALLPPEVAARIAAGEVIERPASVVKELVENALDAGARAIEVLLDGGGLERIRVRDDGRGIPPDQLPDAFERHATSKLRLAEDLFTVRTLGFRGEALAAIVAAADVDLTTRPAAEEAAAVARYRGGRPAGLGAAGAAPGTTVEVRALFAALPARRRFLRDAAAEARAVATVLGHWAIARPEVAFRLESGGRALLATPGDGALGAALAAIHGADLGAGLLPLAGTRARDDGARVAVGGAVGGPAAHRANRRALHLVINGRAVGSRVLLAAIEQAYRGLLPAGRHPAGAVWLEVPLEQVDINMHPQKAEVRLRHERFVAGAAHDAVRAALFGAPAPAFDVGGADAGVWADASRSARLDSTSGSGALTVPFALPSVSDASAWARALEGGARDQLEPNGAPRSPGGNERVLGPLRALGQLGATYLVAESADGLALVDQHAAHERVLYEQALAARRAGRVESQPLLAVVVAPLAPGQALLAAAQAEALAALGWVLEPTDDSALLVRAVPALLGARDPAAALRDYLDQLEAEERLAAPDRAAAALACRAAVRAGDALDAPQQRALLEALEGTAQAQTCPHGRPTLLAVTRAALDRAFARPERSRGR